MISNCGHDENNKYHGGKAGDQTGGEWTVRSWYNRPWTCILRHPDAKVREKIAEYAKSAAKNDNIGYDQWNRLSFWEELQKADYDPAKIKTKCEADCSLGVAAIVKAVGHKFGIKELEDVPTSMVTGNERSALKKAGFTVYTASKYLSSDKYLVPGDILLYDAKDSGHTAINLDTGSKVEETKDGKIQNGTKKTVDEIATEVIAGKWGNGVDRKNRLTAAGYDYDAVQKKVNEKLKGTKEPSNSNPTYKIVNIKSWLNVRKSASTSATVVGKLYNSDLIKVKKISGSWAQIDVYKRSTKNEWSEEYSGYWASTSYIKKV